MTELATSEWRAWHEGLPAADRVRVDLLVRELAQLRAAAQRVERLCSTVEARASVPAHQAAVFTRDVRTAQDARP